MLSILVAPMSAVFAVVSFLVVLSIVVFVHEFGHFLVARWCGVTVRTFSIGFGKEICGFTDRKGTRWRFAWIPLGGYVKFIDDENAASQPSAETLARLTPEERRGAFQSKPIWQRAAVVFAGPAANFHPRDRDLHGCERHGWPSHDPAAHRRGQAGFAGSGGRLSARGYDHQHRRGKIEGFEDVQRIVAGNGTANCTSGSIAAGRISSSKRRRRCWSRTTPSAARSGADLSESRHRRSPNPSTPSGWGLSRPSGSACAKPIWTSRRRCRESATSSRAVKRPIRWAARS